MVAITHPIASMAAFLVDIAVQAPVVVQVPQVAPEPWWKWVIQSVVPVAGGTLIAVLSFVQNRKSEQKQWERNQEAGHELWIRDQCKAEWKEVFSRIAGIEHEIPVIVSGIPKHENLESVVLGILPLLRGMVFIYPALESSGFIEEWETYVQYVSGKFISTTQTNRSVQTETLGGDVVLPEDRERWRELSMKEEIEVRNRLRAFIQKLRDLARKTLETKEERS